ncbi:hypothetical protein BH23GEM8_BH23GEM8_11270 [soil metagenome]
MYYDDEARRFNFVSGLILGSVLGAGLAFFARPRERLTKPRRLRRGYARARGGAERGVSFARDGIADVVQAAVSASRKIPR